jgi:hypothetical protein
MHKGVVHRLHHDHAGAGGALLAAVAKGGIDHPLHRLIQVGAFVDDDAVFAPHFCHHPLQVLLARAPLGGIGVDATAHFPGAGEGNHVHIGVLHQVSPHGGAFGGHKVEHILGHARLVEDFGNFGGDDRGVFRRFEDGAVARHQGAATVMPVVMAMGKFQGEITTPMPWGK